MSKEGYNTPPLAVATALGDIPVVLKINRQAKRIIVKVDSLKRQILVTCPHRQAEGDALAFAKSRAAWIENQLQGGPVALPFRAGTKIPFRGVPTQITYLANTTRAVRYDPAVPEITTGGAPEHLNGRILRWLKHRAREVFHHEVQQFCAKLEVHPSKLTVRDTKTRWGSCAADRALSFSWRLILAPPNILTYVAAHEVAHLRHLDHSPAFWNVVDELVCDRKVAEQWLTMHGASLYGFGVEGASP